jgi:DNA-binding MarR family transcriptional regulator
MKSEHFLTEPLPGSRARVKKIPRNQYESAAALRTALRRFLARTEQVTRRHGLTQERYEMLLLIKTARDGEATVGRLGELLCIGQSAATQLARRVEDAGLIERTISAHDARVHPLRLTEEGERRLAKTLLALDKERAALSLDLLPVLPSIPRRSRSGEQRPQPPNLLRRDKRR